MWTYQQTDELYHYGILGMKWGHRSKTYTPTSISAKIAKYKNKKVDKSFDKWKLNEKLKSDAIELGKKRNKAQLEYEQNKTKESKRSFKIADKQYKQALNKNTIYRKGDISHDVLSDISRLHLSQAKKIKKNMDMNNKENVKKYNELMSKHEIEREKARKQPIKARNRSILKSNIKRTMTTTLKAATLSVGIAGTAYAVNSYLNKHDVYINDKKININKAQLSSLYNAVKKGKNIFKYF